VGFKGFLLDLLNGHFSRSAQLVELENVYSFGGYRNVLVNCIIPFFPLDMTQSFQPALQDGAGLLQMFQASSKIILFSSSNPPFLDPCRWC